MATFISDRNAWEVMENSDLPIMIDFYANWCGPCQWIAPIVDQLAEEYQGKILVCKCDVDTAGRLVQQYDIRNVPTMLFLKNGRITDRHIGMTTKITLRRKMATML